ncbi:hypothetical protein AAFF_G00167060 [Aldrovandia affinis]|uniref:Uncharacterized protein n=1 Tax=Aldrovandia affinis TaxID=143900 RepID=A0AAD7W7K3_9TELE|nr:hypothetical protein AAFF_G00167060 [Aldrovandia affinis]
MDDAAHDEAMAAGSKILTRAISKPRHCLSKEARRSELSSRPREGMQYQEVMTSGCARPIGRAIDRPSAPPIDKALRPGSPKRPFGINEAPGSQEASGAMLAASHEQLSRVRPRLASRGRS